MNKTTKKIRQAAALLLASFLCLTACRSNLTATTMELNKTQGSVNILDGKQKEIEPVEHLDLYSGYQLETLQTSFAWINLDKVKLAKMDAESEIEITKKRNDLEIMLHSGRLFFHITEPLTDKESLNIRTSSMIVGVRGTCGWVENFGQNQMQVYILEGTVGCLGNSTESDQQAEADSSSDSQKKKLSLTNILRSLLEKLPLPGIHASKENDSKEETTAFACTDPDNMESGDSKPDDIPSADSELTESIPADTPPAATEEEMELYALYAQAEEIIYVECIDKDNPVYVSAGQTAKLIRTPEGEEQILLLRFTAEDIPDYIMEELQKNGELKQKISEESGLDIDSAINKSPEQGDKSTESKTYEDEINEDKTYENGTYEDEAYENETYEDEAYEDETYDGETAEDALPEGETAGVSFFSKNNTAYFQGV